MEKLPEYDTRILFRISRRKQGLSREELVKAFGYEALDSLELLQQEGLVKVHQRDLQPFMRGGTGYKDPPLGNILVTQEGRLLLKRWTTKQMLTNRERWKERVFGFLSGVAISVVSWLITQLASR